MRRARRTLLVALSGFALLASVLAVASRAGGGATRRTFVIPHVLERQGTVGTTPFTFDTTIFMTYTPGQAGTPPGPGVSVNLYLFEGAGSQAMKSGTGQDVCNPCGFALNDRARKMSIRIDDLITAKGGFGPSRVVIGYGVVDSTGDVAGLKLQGFIQNSHDTPPGGGSPELNGVHAPFDLPRTPPASPRRGFVLPHVLETSGRTVRGSQFMPFSVDTTLNMLYTTGLVPGTAPGSSASVQLYLFDEQTGMPMAGPGGDVCNPCTFGLTGNTRKRSIALDDLIADKGGFSSSKVRLGYGVIIVSGGDPDGVSLQGFVVNAHTSPFDVSVFVFEPQPLEAVA